MNKSTNKTRLLFVYKLLLHEDRPISISEIQSKLYHYCDITVDRKTLYDDLNIITQFENLQYLPSRGYKIIKGDENNEMSELQE